MIQPSLHPKAMLMIRRGLPFAFILLLHLSALGKISLKCDQADGLYEADSKATITCIVSDTQGEVPSKINLEITDGIYANKRAQTLPLIDGKGTLQLSGDGHIMVRAQLSDNDKASIGVVFNAPAISPSLPAPDDFDTFWADKKAALAKIPAKILKREPVKNWEEYLTKGLHLEQLTIQAWGDTPVVGILAYPEGAKPKSLPAKLGVYWAGVYGSENGPKWLIPKCARAGYVSFHIQPHGITWLESKKYYNELKENRLKNYHKIGSKNRDTSYFLGMYLRIIRGLDILCDNPIWNGTDMTVFGASQGGGQALVAAGLDSRITAVSASIPAMCDHTATALGRHMSWPNLNPNRSDIDTWETSRYFDAVHFAARAKVPAVIGCGLVDSTCPPFNVLAAYNIYGGPKRLVTAPLSGHKMTDPFKKDMAKAEDEFLHKL
ncbi:MAG: acetylxylan esterase [Planctomycetes bacterium]|nr:acetylxylan esterase [Planctomycetota bacterium]